MSKPVPPESWADTAPEEGEIEHRIEIVHRFRPDGKGQKRIHIRAFGNPGIPDLLKLLAAAIRNLGEEMEAQERAAIEAMMRQMHAQGQETRTQGGVILPGLPGNAPVKVLKH